MTQQVANTELLNSVKAILAREWKIESDSIPNDAELNQYERWDSLGHISLMLALEADLGIEITAETVQNLSSIPKIVSYLENKS